MVSITFTNSGSSAWRWSSPGWETSRVWGIQGKNTQWQAASDLPQSLKKHLQDVVYRGWPPLLFYLGMADIKAPE